MIDPMRSMSSIRLAMLRFTCIVLAFIAAAMPRAALAWSTKEHIQLTRIAAKELIADPQTPEPMRQWLRRATPGLLDEAGERAFLLHAHIGMFPHGVDGLPFWATVPDIVAMTDSTGPDARKVDPFGAPERMLHYIDIEFFNPDPEERNYADDLSHKPRAADFPRDVHDPRYLKSGFLPFRVEHTYGKLIEMIRAGKLNDAPGQFPRDETAEKWAGYLAHYVQDNTQPHHATIDYRSASYFPPMPIAPNVHGDMEFSLVDGDLHDYPQLREEFWQLFQSTLREARDPVQTNDPWQATIEVSLASYDALPLIGQAARAAYRRANDPRSTWAFDADSFFHFRGTVDGRETTVIAMKAKQMAWAVKRTERLWRQAWAEATAAAAASRHDGLLRPGAKP